MSLTSKLQLLWNNCHINKTPEWAFKELTKWWKKSQGELQLVLFTEKVLR